MKKIYLMSAAAVLSLAACSDYDDQFHLGNQLTDTKKDLPIVLEASDYATIANLSANKAIADSLDKVAGTTAYTEALAKLGTTKYFSEILPADMFIPAFIQNKYQSADAGSTFKVTYNEYCGKSEYLSDFGNLEDYTLTADDYSTIWAGASTATYLTPSTESKITQALAASKSGAAAGDIVVVNYSYSDFEPAGGGSSEEAGEKYDKISDVIANTDGGEYTVKGKVPAIYKRGFLLTDGTGTILVYKASDDVKIGDEVAVKGTTSQYGGLMQFPNTSEVTVVKQGTGTYTYPTAKTMVAADFESYGDAPYIAYVTYTGTLSISGSYYNVTIDGTEKQGSLAYVPDGMVSADLNGKNVTVYGYTVGSASKGKYVNTMVTSVTEATAAAKASVRRASSASKANKAAVYRFDGSKWSKYTATDASVIAAQPQWYDAIGATSISKHATYLPTFLQQTYPFATDGQKVAVVYKKSSTALAVVEYTYSATEGWAESKEYKTETTTFAKTENGIEAKISMYLNETLLGSEGGFKAYNVNIGTLSYVWTNTTSYGWKASAYSSSTNHAAESWLVSPAINLKKATDPVFYFDEAMNYLGSGNINEHLCVKVSTNFDGSDVTTATWETIELTGRSDGASWTFYTTDAVSLSKYNGNVVYIAFVYKSTEAIAPTYEFKNVVVKENGAEE